MKKLGQSVHTLKVYFGLGSKQRWESKFGIVYEF